MTALISLAVVVAALAAALVFYRAWLSRQPSPQRHHEPFDGTLYQVGEAAIAERRSVAPTATVVCMHGFVEDMRYFAQYYRDPSIQLIVLTSCDYHVAVKDPVFADAPWIQAPTEPPASIGYDAAVLVQALEHLPRTKSVRVHGHSRGGAVALEAARMRPDLFADVEVLLEAPVLPQGRLYAALNAVTLWLYAFVVPGWRREPLGRRFAAAYGLLDDPRKRELLSGLPHNPKHIATLTANVAGIAAWMTERDAEVFANVRRGTVLIADHDKVLDAAAMRASARRAGPTLNVVEVTGSSHFILLDRPDAIPALRRDPA